MYPLDGVHYRAEIAPDREISFPSVSSGLVGYARKKGGIMGGRMIQASLFLANRSFIAPQMTSFPSPVRAEKRMGSAVSASSSFIFR